MLILICCNLYAQDDSAHFTKGVLLFQEGKYSDCTTELDKIKKVGRVISFGTYYDSIINFFLTNIEVIRNDEICYRNIKLYNDIYLKSEKLNIELLALLNTNNELVTEDKKKKDLFIEDKRQLMEGEAQNLKNYYESIINGKSFNKIGDILYDENFRRSYATGSVTITRYTKNYDYVWDTGGEGKIMFTIDVWYSYGYGNLYYDIYYDLYVNGKYFWH